MKITKINDKFSVSDQLDIDDVNTLAANGVEIIVCNRPDNEAESQTCFAEISRRAESLNLSAVHIPFTADTMSSEHNDALAKCIQSGKIIHAYCRTGNRSTTLWRAVQEKMGSKNPQTKPSLPSNTPIAAPFFDVVIVGAGSGGIATAASLLKRNSDLRIALIDPAEHHYYQPGWTLVGGGVFTNTSTRRPTKKLIPRSTAWIAQSVVSFSPDENHVMLDNGQYIHYEHLVVAAGLKLDWGAVEGLTDTLGKNGVTSNYRYDLAPYTWQLVNEVKSGNAVFTQPPMPIKCAGAPQKALYLSADYWLKTQVLDSIDIHFYNAGPVLFGVKDYVPALQSYMDKYNANIHYKYSLKRVDGDKKTAQFVTLDQQGQEAIIETDFQMLHVCPPQCAPDFIRASALSDDAGWLDVDQYTLQHTRYPNIWGVGDAISAPNAKTMAAARKQAPVVAQNICDARNNNELYAVYDGYGSCPLTVEQGKIVLAEFGYGGKLLPTFPTWAINGQQATKRAWFLKAKLLPSVYWLMMLNGIEWFASPKKRS